ncbi:MAG: hypothetical protein E2O44_00740, partial [Nitrospina sp.]
MLKLIPLTAVLLVWVCAFSGQAFAGVVAIDSDFDGKIDQWQYRTAEGKKIKVEYDRDGDGTVEHVEFFRGDNQLERAEFYSDGKINQTQFYSESGKILRVERDSDQDGRVDWWEFFDTAEKIVRVEADQKGDGRVDFWQFFNDEGKIERL